MKHLISVSSEIVLDNYDEGLTDSTGCGLDEKIGITFKTDQDLLDHLHSHYGVGKDIHDYEVNIDSPHSTMQTERTVANHCDAQNGGWMKPTDEEIELWKKGKFKLYCETYVFTFLTVGE